MIPITICLPPLQKIAYSKSVIPSSFELNMSWTTGMSKVSAASKVFTGARLPRKGTISRAVVDKWMQLGCVTYSELLWMYNDEQKKRGYGTGSEAEYIGMNLTRLLKKYGEKQGMPGSRALWKFERSVNV